MHTIALETRINYLTEKDNSRLDYYMGLNRVVQGVPFNPNQGQQQAQVHSIRREGSIQDRIRRAESASADPTLIAKRNIEYNQRIDALLKPETEIVEDPEQKDAV